jgi:hypothetical protein
MRSFSRRDHSRLPMRTAIVGSGSSSFVVMEISLSRAVLPTLADGLLLLLLLFGRLNILLLSPFFLKMETIVSIEY